MARVVLVLMVFLACVAYGSNFERSIRLSTMQSILQDDYRHLNDGYFDGSLPQDTVVVVDDPGTKNGYIGNTDISENPQTKKQIFTIHINPYYNTDLRQAEMTEIHEVCHIAEFDWAGKENDHGPYWIGCMRNLAKEGALDSIW